MKNAGKACNNRLYRHIRTFEKIIKNYFVIYYKFLLPVVSIYHSKRPEYQAFSDNNVPKYGRYFSSRIVSISAYSSSVIKPFSSMDFAIEIAA